MLAVFLDHIAVTPGLLRLADLDTVSVADILQNIPLGKSPTVVRLSIFSEVAPP